MGFIQQTYCNHPFTHQEQFPYILTNVTSPCTKTLLHSHMILIKTGPIFLQISEYKTTQSTEKDNPISISMKNKSSSLTLFSKTNSVKIFNKTSDFTHFNKSVWH